jgi:siroheme synthase/uroporphyrinogen-III synthase
MEALRPVFPAGTRFTALFMDTLGDRDQITQLGAAGVPDDFFTRDLDEALRRGDVDLVVHSAKDLPLTSPPDIATAALLRARDIRDALVLQSGVSLEQRPRIIGTSSPRREQEILRLFPGSKTKPIRGTISDRIEKLDRGEYDAVIVAACALQRLDLEARISDYLAYDPAPQQGRLAITARPDDVDLLRLLRRVDVRRTAGLVALVGCPVDDVLLCRRAEMYLRHCDVVLHDRLIPESVRESIREKAVGVGKAGGQPSTPQAEIHRMLLEHAEQGRLVVRLHGGDPGIYGHLAEELEFLSAWNIRTDIVPAVSAAQVAAARAGISLTHRGGGRRVTFASGHEGGGPDGLPGPSAGNVAIYMGARDVLATRQSLQQAGWPGHSTVIVGQGLGTRHEVIFRTDVDQVHNAPIESPAVFLLGAKVVPPVDATLFLGTDPEHFLAHGPLLHWPLIRLEPVPLEDRIRCLTEQLDKVRGVIFPSRVAARCFAEALMAWKDVRALGDKLLLAVGPATAAELAGFGLRADCTADGFEGVRSLAGKLQPEWAGPYLYPCSDAAPVQARRERISSGGIELVARTFYLNRQVDPGPLPRRSFERVIFTSGSTVEAYFTLYPAELKARRAWLAVGPSTLEALKALGLDADTISA